MSQLTPPTCAPVDSILACVHCARSKAKCDRKVQGSTFRDVNESMLRRGELGTMLAMQSEEALLPNPSPTAGPRPIIRE